jgi:hypothetical protein
LAVKPAADEDEALREEARALLRKHPMLHRFASDVRVTRIEQDAELRIYFRGPGDFEAGAAMRLDVTRYPQHGCGANLEAFLDECEAAWVREYDAWLVKEAG